MFDAAFLSRMAAGFGAAFVAYVLAMWAAMVVWTHRDISSRSSDPGLRLLADVLVAAFSLPGFLLYLALRPPETRADGLARQLEAEALVRDIETIPACAACGHGLAADFVACPHCAAMLQEACRCGRRLRASWVICPYCTTERAATRIPAPRPGLPPLPITARRTQGAAQPAVRLTL